MNAPPLRLVALEITRTCNLACRHCRGDSRQASYSNELRFDEITAVLDNIASFSRPIIIITGGEPLTRKDVFDIAEYSVSLGLRTVLATCGHGLDDDTVKNLIDSGVSRISVSLDGASAATHDSFRGVTGAFDAALRGLRTAGAHGLDFQINSTLTKLNIGELEAIHDLAVDIGSVGFHPFLLVPMGRGKGLAEYALSGEEYEAALVHIVKMAAQSPIEIKPTCSPHYIRVAGQTGAQSAPHADNISKRESHGHRETEHHTTPSTAKDRPRYAMTKGCLGGQGFVFISHVGNIQMCGFLEIEAGDLRTCGYNLGQIWETSEFFKEIRDIDRYHGKCGVCEYRHVCGGCRARAYYVNGDYLGEEPHCIYIPDALI